MPWLPEPLSRLVGPRSAGPPAESGRVFELARQLGAADGLQGVLRALVDGVHAWGTTRAVMVRLYSPRTRLYEARAFAGLDDARIAQLSNLDVTEEQFRELSRRAEGLGRSYRLRLHADGPFGEVSMVEDAGDVLLVPLWSDDGVAMGYLAAQLGARTGVADARRCAAELEDVAILAVGAIRTARLQGELEHRKLELSLATDKLQELQRLKENFVATVSHELRTPLTSIKAYAETLDRSGDRMDPQMVHEFTGIIVEESDRLNRIFDDILDVDHLAHGRLRMMADDFDLRDLVDEVRQELSEELEERQLHLQVASTRDDIVVHADRVAIHQVLHNLVGNAIKFSPPGAELRVLVSDAVSMIRITVEDAGIGIPEEETERVFDRFHQVDNSATRAYGGQGLGLAICRDIVQWHRGRIWAERSSLGGAKLVVLLPRKGFVVAPDALDAADPTERRERQTFLHLATGLVSEVLGTRIVSLMLVDGEELRIEAAVGLEEEVVASTRLRRGEGVAGAVWSEQASLLVPDLDADPRFAGRRNEVQYPNRSLLSCPLEWDGEFLGVVNVNNKADGTDLDDHDRLLLEAVASRVACALSTYTGFRDAYRELSGATDALRSIVDIRRERRTPLREALVDCGVQTATDLGLEEDDRRAFGFLLRTYDLGLSRVGEHILRKVAPLSAEERTRVEDHVREGTDLAAGLGLPPRALRVLLHHHENFDGSGYPDGLAGEAIPLGSRLIRLVDALAAALHDHPFRRRLSLDEALDVLREGQGRRFCPRITPLFLDRVQARRDQLEQLLEARVHEGPVVPQPVTAGGREAP